MNDTVRKARRLLVFVLAGFVFQILNLIAYSIYRDTGAVHEIIGNRELYGIVAPYVNRINVTDERIAANLALYFTLAYCIFAASLIPVARSLSRLFVGRILVTSGVLVVVPSLFALFGMDTRSIKLSRLGDGQVFPYVGPILSIYLGLFILIGATRHAAGPKARADDIASSKPSLRSTTPKT
jgi:hypothetical protein